MRMLRQRKKNASFRVILNKPFGLGGFWDYAKKSRALGSWSLCTTRETFQRWCKLTGEQEGERKSHSRGINYSNFTQQRSIRVQLDGKYFRVSLSLSLQPPSFAAINQCLWGRRIHFPSLKMCHSWVALNWVSIRKVSATTTIESPASTQKRVWKWSIMELLSRRAEDEWRVEELFGSGSPYASTFFNPLCATQHLKGRRDRNFKSLHRPFVIFKSQ